MFAELWNTFTPYQRRNIAIYALGIMCYKFALEYYNGSFITQANERFGDRRYEKIGILVGVNYAAQSIGSIMVAPLIKRYPTRTVLAIAVLTFGIISAIPLIADAATGGVSKFKTANNKTQYGTWNPNGLFPIYTISGVAFGTVELIRRVIPRDIVGGDIQRLRRMDALVHVLNEVAGTIGAFTSVSLIGTFGYNHSAFLSPVLFTFAGFCWFFVSDTAEFQSDAKNQQEALAELEFGKQSQTSLVGQVWVAVRSFGKAFGYGAWIVLRDRRFLWLLPGYTLALYGHRYLESGLSPIFAKQIIGTSAYSQIINGGSNFGELLGALAVFSNAVPTPIPWIRLDALLLNLVWVMPFFPYVRNSVGTAWSLAAVFVPISFGWAAGDVSLAAYIQSTLARMESTDKDVSALGAVMAFLYVSCIILFSVLSTVLGRWVDRKLKGLKGADTVEPARYALKMVGGVHFTVLSAVILAATFIPKGSFAFNPKVIDPSLLVKDEENQQERQQEESFDKEHSKEEDAIATAGAA